MAEEYDVSTGEAGLSASGSRAESLNKAKIFGVIEVPRHGSVFIKDVSATAPEAGFGQDETRAAQSVRKVGMDEDIPEGYAAQPIEAGVPQLAPRAYLSSPDAETTIRLDDVEAQLFSSEGIRYKATGLDVPEEVGTVTDRQDGTFAFTPRTPDDRGGRIPVEVSVQDGEVVTQKQINLAPVVSGAVELEMNEDGTLIISSEQLLESAHDAQGDALSAFNLEAEGGTLIDNGDGTWAFIPDEHFYGEIKIRYMVSDGVHQIPAQGVVHIAEVNDAPVIGDVPEAAVLEGDGLMAGQLESEDVDDHEIAVFSVSEGHAAPAGFVLDADGHYSFDATVDAYAHLNVGDSVVLTVPVTVTDRAGATDFTQVRITVNGTNDAPVAGAEVLASVDEAAGAITGQITATDVDDDAVLTFTVGEGTVAPAGFTLNPDGSFVFNPADTAYDYLNAGDSVTLTVPVTVTDEHGATDISRIRITVGGTNDAPVAGAEVLASVDEGAAAISGQLLATDADDDAVLTFTVGEGTAVPAGFTLNPDGSFVFNPADIAYEHLGAGDSVTLTVPVTVTDEHGATDASEIRITVDGTNDVPVVSESVSFAVREDVGLLITEEELLAYAADIDGDVLSVRNLTSENGAIADNGDGTWTFTPDEHFSGEAVLAYDVTDGIDSTRVGATVVVEGVADGAAITLEGVAGESLASFGDDNIVGSGGSAQLNGWETDNVGGFIESYDDGVYGVEDGRGKVVELERNRGDASNIYRNVDVEAGDTVRLTFDLSARAGRGGEDSAVDVMWEGQVIDTIVPEVGWESYSYTFTATTDQPRLELKATDNNSTGAVLDVIQVSEVVTDVLEDNAVAVRLDAALIDADGSETLTALSVDDLAVGSIVSDGVNEVAISEAGQAVDVMGWDLNNLTITPEPNFNGELVVHVSATTEEANGDTRTTTASTSFDILPVNDATEVSGPTRFATDEDTGFVLTEDLLLATATDVDGDVLGIRNLSAENGTVIDNGDGTWTFVPAQDFNGEARLFYDIFDGTGLVPAHGLIDVAAVNDVPVAEDAVVDADEGGVPVTGQVAAVDVDDGAVLTFTLGEGTTAPAGFTLNPDGSFVFNPADIAYDHLGAGDSMTLTVPVTVTDEHGATDASLVRITVDGTNDTPVAGAEVLASVDEGIGAISGQLTATDADADAILTFTVSEGTTAPAGFTLNPDGSFVFNPADSAYDYLNVGDSVTLTVPVTVTDEHGATDASQIRITVDGTNDAPVAGAEVLASVDEGAGAISGQLTATDADADAILTFTVSEGTTAPAGFTLNPDGSFVFDPTGPAYDHLGAGDSMTLTVPVTVTDEHGATDASLVRITVDGTNDAPVVSEGVALAAREDTGIILTEEQLLAHASDVDGGVLSVQNLSAENGVIADNGNGTWTFTPSKHFSGQATLSYEVFDGTDSTPASGIVAVGAVADAPTVFVQVANLDYQPNDTADFSEAQAGVRFDLTNHDAQTVDGSTDRWDAAEATGSDFDDTFSFSDLQAGETYTVHGGGGTNTIDLSAFSSDRVTLDNEARILTVDVDGAGNTATIHYDNVTRVDFDTSVFDGSPHSVELATDHDWRIEGKSIEVFSRGGSDWAVTPVGFAGALDENYTLEATVTAHRDGSWANGAIVFDYQDENNFKMAVARIGADRWSIEQFSNGVHSTIAQTGYIRLDRAVLNTIELRVEGSVASIFSGGELQVSHDFGEPLNDGRIGVATNNSHTSFELDMAPSNWAPSVEDYDIRMQLQDGAIATDNVLQDAVDPEGAELVLAGFSQGAHGTVTDNGDGTFSYRPAAGWVGSDSFTYQVSDGVNVTEGTVNVDVQGDAAVSILRGETVSLDLGASLVDADGSETLTVRLEGVPEGVSLTDGTITRVAGADGVIDVSDMNTDQMTLTPPPEFRDGFEVTVRATATEQDGGSAETTSIFDVFIINDAPVITGPAEFTLAEDGTLTITAEDLLANVADPNNDALTVQNLATADGSLADNGDGTWTFTPDGDFNGQIALSYDVDDGMDTVPATGTIVVTPVNDAPVAGAEVLASVDEGAAAVSGQLTATDADDDAMLTFTVSEGTTAPAGFTLNPDGSFVFDPADSAYDYLNVGDSVTLTVPVTVADEHGATDAGQIRITVGGTNDAPVAGAEVLASADEGAGTITGQVTAVDVDDDAVLAFSISEGAVAPAGFTLSPDGSFTFDPSDPAYDHLGAGDSVTLTMPVTVADEHGATDSSQVRITVTGTNDAPVVSESVVVAAQEDTALVITEEQLLANVSDAEGDGLSVENLAAAGGSLADNGNGTWTFTPDADFSGDVALSYDVSDGTASTHVNGTISVAGVADGATITLEGAVGESLASFGDDNITKRGPAAKLSGWETDNAGGHVEAYEDWVYGVEDGRGLVVELERNRADASNIYRYMDVEEGDTARLTFDLSARAEGAGEDSGVDVMWEGQVVDTIVPEVGWESYTYTFTATEDQPRLELKATNADGFGAVLDVIQVSEVTTDVLEDSAVAVKLDAQLLDIDGSESLQSLTVDDLAVGATVSDGANTVVVAEAGQAVDVRDWDLNNLTIKPEPDFSGELVIHVSATTRDTGGDTRTTTASTSFDIVGVNDAPVVAVTDASVASGATQAVATASDVDGIIDSHTLSAVHGTAVLDADGNILYTSEDGYIGSDTITISLTDDVGAVTQETLTLDVRNPVIGTGRDDVLTGTADNDFISGLSGDDVLEGGGGSDELAGGDGIDTVVFSGARDEYRIAETGEGVFTVTDTVSDRDGGDTLSQMEILQFNDQTLTYNGEDWVQQVEAAPEAMLAQEDGNWLGAVEEPAAEEHVGGEAEPDMDAGTEDGSPLADLDAEDANTLII